MPLTIVFVHGWSVTNLDTYGELPQRLRNAGEANNMDMKIEEIFLGRYISFHDEVRVADVSRAFEAAVNDQLAALLKSSSRFICITHSTGGPVIRDWWNRYYPSGGKTCPLSHLIMLAPANFGSALAQLGKSRVSRLKSWAEGIEPGQGVLDWLELGSKEAWLLNKEWISGNRMVINDSSVFPFVITGQDIDRSLYDHLNSYTGEIGSDGVVRVAAANLNSRYVKLEQVRKNDVFTGLEKTEFKESPETALRVLHKKSHSGDDMGIMKSVKANPDDKASDETVKAILDCIRVKNIKDYQDLCGHFKDETKQTQEDPDEKIEQIDRRILPDRTFIHDRFSMVIFRLIDSDGNPVSDFDLLLTAGEDNDPDHLPEGFLADRQRNHLSPEIITYNFNYDIMKGSPEIKKDGKVLRNEIKGTTKLGLQIDPRPKAGFVRFSACGIEASEELLDIVLKPNSTTLIEICLYRKVSNEVFRLVDFNDRLADDGSFKDMKPGDIII